MSARSSGLGVGSPDGWLWKSTIAAAAAAAASRNTSRGCTTVESSEPIDTILMRMTRCLVSSMTMPNCSTDRGAVLRQQIGGQLARRRPAAAVRPSRARASGVPARPPPGSAPRARGRRRDTRRSSPTVHARQPVQAARALDQAVGQLQRVAAARAAAEHERQQLVVAEPRAPSRSSFSRGRSCGATSFIYTQYSMSSMLVGGRPVRLRGVVAALVSRRRVRRPPNKEMDQAQGAIDAARAAGAERYAATEYTAATEALKNANDAVAGRRLPPRPQPRAREPRAGPERRARPPPTARRASAAKSSAPWRKSPP